jgi:hypothetical protein
MVWTIFVVFLTVYVRPIFTGHSVWIVTHVLVTLPATRTVAVALNAPTATVAYFISTLNLHTWAGVTIACISPTVTRCVFVDFRFNI